MAGKILLIDDSTLVRSEIKAMLKGFDVTILEAVDGREGLVAIAQNTDIDLVLLDVNMPVMDGLTMIEHLKDQLEASGRQRIPIVMLTTENSSEKVVRAKKAGITGWIIKPPQRAQILGLVEKFLLKTAA